MSYGENFVIWLQGEMDKQGWSQSDLAREAKISRQSISNIMNQQRAPGTEVCTAIAVAFRLNPTEVFIRAGLLPEEKTGNAILEDIKYKLSLIPEDKLGVVGDLLDSLLMKFHASNVSMAAEEKKEYKISKKK